MTFEDGSAALDTVTVASDGTARLSISSLSIGTHSIKVVYGGDAELQDQYIGGAETGGR